MPATTLAAITPLEVILFCKTFITLRGEVVITVAKKLRLLFTLF